MVIVWVFTVLFFQYLCMFHNCYHEMLWGKKESPDFFLLALIMNEGSSRGGRAT